MGAQLNIILSVDWEGLSVDPKNIQGIRGFKAKYSVPLVHYMNPAYFTHPGLEQGHPDIQIANCLFADDELGLHLHGVKHFVRQSGVLFRSQPSFSRAGDQNGGELCGQEVMLHGYTPLEFKKLLQFACETLKQKGFVRPCSFRAGGWMISPEQIKVLEECGFVVDSSAVPSFCLENSSWKNESLHRYVNLLWDGIHTNSQPYWFSSQKKILEIPNNLGAIDYWSDDLIKKYCEQLIRLSDDGESSVVVVTAHQETFVDYIYRFEKLISDLTPYVTLNFVTNKEIYKKKRANFLQKKKVWSNQYVYN